MEQLAVQGYVVLQKAEERMAQVLVDPFQSLQKYVSETIRELCRRRVNNLVLESSSD